jgi:predicted HTH transcriptional regulator
MALKELLVNALVHRAYDQEHRLRIDVDTKFIRFTNPGGLVDAVFQQVNTRLQEQIELGTRGITGYRNPVIADLFYGAGAMDKEGSGLPDVHSQVMQNEGNFPCRRAGCSPARSPRERRRSW